MSNPQYFPNGQGQGPDQYVTTDNERLWAVLAHLSALIGILISMGSAGWLIPLIIFLVYKDSSPFVRRAAAGALNFAIIMLVASLVGGVLFGIGFGFIWLVFPIIFLILGGLILLLVLGASVIIPILAAVEANKGRVYTYPLTPQMIR